jgi:hypothetical protein
LTFTLRTFTDLDFPRLENVLSWGRFFVHFFRGKFSPKNVGKKWNFPRKKFRKIVFQRNSTEFSAESDFLRNFFLRKVGPWAQWKKSCFGKGEVPN